MKLWASLEGLEGAAEFFFPFLFFFFFSFHGFLFDNIDSTKYFLGAFFFFTFFFRLSRVHVYLLYWVTSQPLPFFAT